MAISRGVMANWPHCMALGEQPNLVMGMGEGPMGTGEWPDGEWPNGDG